MFDLSLNAFYIDLLISRRIFKLNIKTMKVSGPSINLLINWCLIAMSKLKKEKWKIKSTKMLPRRKNLSKMHSSSIIFYLKLEKMTSANFQQSMIINDIVKPNNEIFRSHGKVWKENNMALILFDVWSLNVSKNGQNLLFLCVVKIHGSILVFVLGSNEPLTRSQHSFSTPVVNRYTTDKKVPHTAGVAFGRHLAPRIISALWIPFDFNQHFINWNNKISAREFEWRRNATDGCIG